jgi:hypothetical protein
MCLWFVLLVAAASATVAFAAAGEIRTYQTNVTCRNANLATCTHVNSVVFLHTHEIQDTMRCICAYAVIGLCIRLFMFVRAHCFCIQSVCVANTIYLA